MKHLQTEILVIGGGATGTGIARDLGMRGFKAILVEKGDLTHGTTGRYHGLLHSGGRYVVKDPLAARECIQENHILRRIMPHCIEDTGGFFVLTPWDDPEYVPRFLEGCRTAGIPAEEVPVAQMLREEPLLNPRISRCFRLPDGSADSFLGADANAASARQHGAQILNYHKVTRLVASQDGRSVVGAVCQDLVKDEEVSIQADLVINASGAWAGQIAASLGLKVHIIGGKGTMLAMNHRIVNTVINRCKMPSDGDILVPAHTVSVIGTTDVKIDDPDHYAIEPWEVQLCLEEGDKLVPGFKNMRILRAWAGVRPLYQESEVQDTRDVTRAFVLLDHEKRDGVAGLITITSGKWTTYRKMAEVTVDLACQKLGVQRPCRTHLEPLPDSAGRGHHYLGERLGHVEKAQSYGRLICECELATYDDVVNAITQGEAKTIDDLRRDVRLGMGPCQGGFCTFRVAGILQALRHPPVAETNVALRDFLQERWKGLLPILWGQQLRQERLDELIYLSILNADHLPGPQESRLGPVPYEPPSQPQPEDPGESTQAPQGGQRPEKSPSPQPRLDVLVVGAGPAGLAAAWRAASRGKQTRLVAKGWGTTHWHTGCIDVLGYHPAEDTEPLESPAAGLSQLIRENPRHPYALAGLENIETALGAFQKLCEEAGYPLQGSLERNWLLPSALGIPRPTCLAPQTMIAGDLRRRDPLLIVGFEGFPDFYPDWIAANLSAQGFPARGVSLDLFTLRERRFVTGRVLTDLFERPNFRLEVIEALQPNLGEAARLGFPAVLGMQGALAVHADLERGLGLPVFEIPGLPPSTPGIRLHNILRAEIERLGGRVFEGMEALEADTNGGQVTTLWTEAAARRKAHRAQNFILATGGILGGGIRGEYGGVLRETVLNLAVAAPTWQAGWFQQVFLAHGGHPVFRAGLQVDDSFRPLDSSGKAAYENLYAAGITLAHGDFIRERSLDGVSLVTGFLVGEQI